MELYLTSIKYSSVALIKLSLFLLCSHTGIFIHAALFKWTCHILQMQVILDMKYRMIIRLKCFYFHLRIDDLFFFTITDFY